MGKNIHILFNTSELTAGTRGASLGPGAIITAARKSHDSFFGDYPYTWLTSANDQLNQPPKFQYAKYIDGLIEIVSNLSKSIQNIVDQGAFPLIIAGDHGSAAGTIIGLKKKYNDKKLGVIWIDAHGDLHTPYTTPSGNMHGMPLSVALGEDNLDCKRNEPSVEEIEKWEHLKSMAGSKTIESEHLFFIGVRDTEKEEDYLLKKHAIRNYTVQEVRQNGPEGWKKELTEFIEKIDVLYVSLDVDSMDPDLTSYGTGTPVKNGLRQEEAQEIIQFLANQDKLVGLEFVEVNPCLDDKKNRMAEITFELIKQAVKTIEKK